MGEQIVSLGSNPALRDGFHGQSDLFPIRLVPGVFHVLYAGKVLATAVISGTHDDDFGLTIRKLIIDGPSMVYHVNSALAKSDPVCTSTFGVPTYLQLNAAIDVFLTDLELSGAKIEYIFFDGALPVAKRSTRLERLERSRFQLEQVKNLGLTPVSLNLFPGSDRKELSKILWQTKTGSTRSTSLTAPFIVPAAIEYLSNSNWSRAVSVVHGEAESFCASAAKETGASVLSNDSDFTLLADMQADGIVGMLHSLNVSHFVNERPTSMSLQCWRPAQVKRKLNTQGLTRPAFERSKDATATFATIMQRSAKHLTKDEACTFACFEEQFESPTTADSTKATTIRPPLSGVDPRLAELICQLSEAINESPSIFKDQSVWVTMPILLEDPGKDASWTYGREMRRLAYSLLVARFASSYLVPITSITEAIRKGQRIAQDIIELFPPSENQIVDAIRSCLADLAYLSNPTISLAEGVDPQAHNARTYILWALTTIVRQRAATEKPAIPTSIISMYLGLSGADTHHRLNPSDRKSKASGPDPETHWRLLHLNANVQAVMYSLRILRQSCTFLRDNVPAMFRDASYKEDEVIKLLQLTESMPPIQDLFLEIDGVRMLMQRFPLSWGDAAYAELFPHDPVSQQLSSVKDSDDGANDVAMEEVVSRKKRKKRAKSARGADGDREKTNNGSKELPPRRKFSENPYDLLMK